MLRAFSSPQLTFFYCNFFCSFSLHCQDNLKTCFLKVNTVFLFPHLFSILFYLFSPFLLTVNV